MVQPFCLCCPPDRSSVSLDSTEKASRLRTALILVGSFSGFELIMGWISHSLSLLADGGHMLFDGFALGMALLAAGLAAKARSKSAGQTRMEVITALINSLGLLIMAGWIGWEAIAHLQGDHPHDICTLPMLIAALVGLGVNGVSAILLGQQRQEDLNLQGAFLHVMADTLSSIGVMLAALAVWILNWQWADSVISLGVAGLIGLGTLPLVRESLSLLLHPLDPLETLTWDLDQIEPSSPETEPISLQKLGFLEVGRSEFRDLIKRDVG